ncbi:MAG: V-type ATPase subunit [Clostridiales bacterium]|nr:V-type ATPase subunit [Clostridiales bacterium]
MNRYSENEYYYSSARIAAMSCRLIGTKELLSLSESVSLRQAFDRLSEFGIEPVFRVGMPDVEGTLRAHAEKTYSALSEFLPDPQPLAIVRARYDSHNLKAAIKCAFLGTDPAPYLIDCGTVPAADAVEAAKNRDFSGYPDILGKAAGEAAGELTRSGLVRKLESTLDSACFAYMSALAESFAAEPVSELLSLKIDLTNLVIMSRVGRLASPPESLLEDSLIRGGRIPFEAFEGARLPTDAFDTHYGETVGDILKASVFDGSSPSDISAASDRAFTAETKRLCGSEQLGLLPVIGYIISFEYLIKNLRILLSGLENGLSSEKIREELRI